MAELWTTVCVYHWPPKKWKSVFFSILSRWPQQLTVKKVKYRNKKIDLVSVPDVKGRLSWWLWIGRRKSHGVVRETSPRNDSAAHGEAGLKLEETDGGSNLLNESRISVPEALGHAAMGMGFYQDDSNDTTRLTVVLTHRFMLLSIVDSRYYSCL